MKLRNVFGGVFLSLLVGFAARENWKFNTLKTVPKAARDHYHHPLRPTAGMEKWHPVYELSSNQSKLFRKVAWLQMDSWSQGGAGLPTYKFSDPLAIRNPWLPLATLVLDVLDGTNNGQTDHIERSIVQGRTKTFMIDGQTVQALVLEDKESVGGNLSEITYDYYAQDDSGNVHYLGEDATQYTNGQPSGHEGSWLYGVDTLYIGTIFPGYPQVGQTWEAENVQVRGVGVEHDTLIGNNAMITVPAGTFRNCMETLEITPGEQENKWYCPSVGTVKEYISATNFVTLTSHQSSYKLP